MKKILLLLLCCACFAGSLPVSRQAAFFAPNPAVVSSGGGGGSNYAKVFNVGKGGDANSAVTSATDSTGCKLIVICLSGFNAIPTPTDSKGNTYTEAVSQSAGGYQCSIWYCFNPTVGSGHTFTASQSSTFPTLSIIGFSGGTLALDTTSHNGSGGVSTLQPGSITPAQDNEVVVSVFTGAATTACSVDSPFTISDQNITTAGAERGAGAYVIQTTATTSNPTWANNSSANDMLVAQAAFK